VIVAQMKCQMCGERFEVKLLDRNDPRERNVVGSPVRCPRCHSLEVEMIRQERRAS
jgi:Zn finger protein HypA/HybF involved in hydrogenase expression